MERFAKIAAFNYFRKTFQKWLLLLFIYLVYKNTYEDEILSWKFSKKLNSIDTFTNVIINSIMKLSAIVFITV